MMDWRARHSPLQGWNAWNTFSVDGKPLRGGRAEYESVAEVLVSAGYRDAGYNVVSTVCTDWVARDAAGRLQQNLTLWPGGMRSFAEYLHGKGLLLSVYTDAGTTNCCGEPGSAGHEALDMATFAEWGADMVSVDFCNLAPGAATHVRETYQRYADGAARSSNPDMYVGVFNLGYGRPWTWAPTLRRTPFFRVTGDIGNAWQDPPGKRLPTMGLLATVDAIQAIPDLDRLTGVGSGSYAMYGQLAGSAARFELTAPAAPPTQAGPRPAPHRRPRARTAHGQTSRPRRTPPPARAPRSSGRTRR